MTSWDNWEADQSMLQRQETGPGGTGWHWDKHHRCHGHLSHPSGHLGHCLRHLSCHLWHLWLHVLRVLHRLHHGVRRRRLHWPWSHQSRRWWHRSPPWHCGRHGWPWRPWRVWRLDWDLRLAPRTETQKRQLLTEAIFFCLIIHIYTYIPGTLLDWKKRFLSQKTVLGKRVGKKCSRTLFTVRNCLCICGYNSNFRKILFLN